MTKLRPLPAIGDRIKLVDNWPCAGEVVAISVDERALLVRLWSPTKRRWRYEAITALEWTVVGAFYLHARAGRPLAEGTIWRGGRERRSEEAA